MLKSKKGASKNDFFRMRRGDVQFTTGGSGIAHSEQNEDTKDWVHFLQIWALPWAKGLPPIYHTMTFDEEAKRKAFVTIISPLKAGIKATAEEEKAALPAIPGTIPVHADLLVGAAIITPGKTFNWTVGVEGAVTSKSNRHIYVHLPMTKGGKAKIRLDGRHDSVLSEGDGAFISSINAGDVLSIESVGVAESEIVVLDSN
jgi:hypothetical protein